MIAPLLVLLGIVGMALSAKVDPCAWAVVSRRRRITAIVLCYGGMLCFLVGVLLAAASDPVFVRVP